MVVPRLIWQFASIAMAACCLLGGIPCAADSILAGKVTDAITLQPVAGADVQIEYSGQTVGAGTTDLDGFYRAPFTIPGAAPAVATMTASARSAAYGVTRSDFQVSAGAPFRAHDIKLFPVGVIECRSKTNHSVIVGNFLPPTGGVLSDLSKRIARSLDFALNTRLQTVRLSLDVLPSFEDCDAAKPQTIRLGANFAKALRADAFVDGEVSHAVDSAGFKVSMSVSDAYDLFSVPLTASNKSVDLDNPSGASVAAETHVAVLAAIAAGLAGKNDCVTAIAVLSVAERLVDAVPPYITSLRITCQSVVPNAGLRSTP